VIYLDNAATTYPKPECVKNALLDFMQNCGANAGRSGHAMSIDSGRVVFEARKSLADMLGIKHPMNVAFTLNATHALNLAIQGVVKKGDVVVTSPFEHNSVKRVLNAYDGIEIRVLKTDKFGHLVDVKESLKGANVVILVHANNVSGMILPVDEIFKLAKENGATTILDAAQSAGVLDISTKYTDIVCASGHKGLYGIQGTGFIALSDKFDISKIKPLMQGGTGSKSEHEIHPNFMPDMLEAGTLNAHGIATVKAGIEFINSLKKDEIINHERELREFLRSELLKMSEFKILEVPPSYETIGNLSFTHERLSPSEISLKLNEKGFCVRASLHCNPGTHKFYGTSPDGAVRVSPGYFTTLEEMESLVSVLREI